MAPRGALPTWSRGNGFLTPSRRAVPSLITVPCIPTCSGKLSSSKVDIILPREPSRKGTRVMKRLTARYGPVVALLFFATALAAQSDLPIRDTTMANGLHVIVIENHALPLVTVELDVKNGAYTQSPETEGLAHLYEHMFFKANRTIPSQERYLERLRELGASWNGTTSEELVNYFVTVGTDSVAPALRFMEDAVRYPLFLQEELVRERPVVLG